VRSKIILVFLVIFVLVLALVVGIYYLKIYRAPEQTYITRSYSILNVFQIMSGGNSSFERIIVWTSGYTNAILINVTSVLIQTRYTGCTVDFPTGNVTNWSVQPNSTVYVGSLVETASTGYPQMGTIFAVYYASNSTSTQVIYQSSSDTSRNITVTNVPTYTGSCV
jgi:hypothetical protein